MKKIFLIIMCSFFATAYSQRAIIRSSIDSLYHSRWDSTAIDLDSLANPQLVEIPKITMDSVIIKQKTATPESHAFPITPFNLVNYEAPKRWFFSGQNNLVFNQSSFSNWNSGGNNNIGVTAKINYNLSYKDGRHYLENILQTGYGFLAAKGQSTRKTDDHINLMSNYGYELGRNYYLSAGYQLLTQYMPGYNYAATPNPHYEHRVSKFMAPGYLNAGVGISFNPNENFQVIFRPANGKFTFVTDPLLQKKGRYGLEKDGQSARSELGAMLNILYRLNIYKDITLVNQLNFFTNYQYHTERMDINYSGVLNIKFNKFISGIVGADIIYDHDQIAEVQVKQILGLGFVYKMGAETLPKNKKVIKPFVAMN